MADISLARDFIYLDVERVRSIYAQVEKGVIQSTADEKASEQRATGAISGGVPLLAKGEAEGSLVWSKRSTETRTLHDHMYNLVEARLKDCGLMVDLAAGALGPEWDRAAFASATSPTSFVRCKGHVRLNDFRQMVSLIREMHDLAEAIVSFQLLGHAEGRSKHAIQQMRNEALAKMAMPDKKFLVDLARVLETLYGESVVLKVLPEGCRGDCGFVLPLTKLYIRDPVEDLALKFGPTPENPWTVVGQIANAPPGGSPSTGPAMPESPHDLDRAVETMFDAFRELMSVGTVRYPYISMTPLAVYRE